jgi:hypothetical protein
VLGGQRNRSHNVCVPKIQFQIRCAHSPSRLLKLSQDSENVPSGIQETLYKNATISPYFGRHSLKQNGVALFRSRVKRMGQRRSWEVNSLSVSSKCFSPFAEPEASLTCSQIQTAGIYSESHIYPLYHLRPHSVEHIS